ncbi:MAG: phage integrase N-terminal SAM-like domain-containing protein [candidate division KSB1 bacterium]|nr:phage integrase N-terminal SAM-like domain-containing protein [candidate division KSB1 bacterium]
MAETNDTCLTLSCRFLETIAKPAESVTADDIRRYLYTMKTLKKGSQANLKQACSAIKFLYRNTLDRLITRICTAWLPEADYPMTALVQPAQDKSETPCFYTCECDIGFV